MRRVMSGFAEGKFVVFEGVDGCGKGTQIKIAAGYIFELDKRNEVLITREPTWRFSEIRSRMAQAKDTKQHAEWFVEMFLNDRQQHLEQTILPSLERGVHVLCDRYKYSTMAYQHNQGFDLNRLISMQRTFRIPDLTLLFDCSAKIAFERRKSGGAVDTFEKDLDFQQRLRNTYLSLPKLLNGTTNPENEGRYENIVVINAEQSVSDIFNDVKKKH